MGQAATSAYIGRIYTDHGAWLGRWLARRTDCPARAADLAHDTFRRLLERADIAPFEDPRRFLATVARRLLTDDIRHREVERAYLDALGAEASIDFVTPERRIAAVQLLDAVVRILDGLSTQVREAFIARRIDGLSYDEIAHRMGVSGRTVKRYVVQAYAHCYDLAYPEG